MNCPKCNALNEDNASVCINCGELLDTEDEFAPALDKNARLEEIQQRRIRKKVKQRRKKVIGICIAIAAVVAAAAYGVYSFKNNLEDDPSNVVVITPSVLPAQTLEPTIIPEETPLIDPTATDLPLTELPVITGEAPIVGAVTSLPTEKAPVVAEKTPMPVITKKPAATKKPASTPKAAKPTAKPVPKETFEAATVTQTPVEQGKPINSQIVQVLSVEKAAATGEPVAKLAMGNEIYFAYANTDAFPAGVPGVYSIHAVPSNDIYYGQPVYVMLSINEVSKGDYIIADSSSRLLTEPDLQGLTKAQLELARNEIFARHGRAFKRADIQSYFESKSWYKQNPNYNYTNDYANLSDIELTNARFILAHE